MTIDSANITRDSSVSLRMVTADTVRAIRRLEVLVESIYHVVAYTCGDNSLLAGLKGGFSLALACGIQESRTDFALVDVTVRSNQTIERVKTIY